MPRNQEFATVSEDTRDLFPKPPAGVSTATAAARSLSRRRQFQFPAPAAPPPARRAAVADVGRAHAVSGATDVLSASGEARRLGEAALERGDFVAAAEHYERALDESASESMSQSPQILSAAAASAVAPVPIREEARAAAPPAGGDVETPVAPTAPDAAPAPTETARTVFDAKMATHTDRKKAERDAWRLYATLKNIDSARPTSRKTNWYQKLLTELETTPPATVKAAFAPVEVHWRDATRGNIDLVVFAGDEKLDAAGNPIATQYDRWTSSFIAARDHENLPLGVTSQQLDELVKNGGGVSADRTFAARKVTAQNRDDKNVRRGVPSSDGVGRRRTGQRMREDAAAEETKEATDRAANAAAQTASDRGRQRLHAAALGDDGVVLVAPPGDAAVRAAEQEEKPAAIAVASRNAIQEAKNRKAAARARMAERKAAVAESTTTTEAAGPAPTVTDYTARADALLEYLASKGLTTDHAHAVAAMESSHGHGPGAIAFLSRNNYLRAASRT